MKKYMYLGLLSALISSIVIYFYMYSMYSFVPKGSPDPLVSMDSNMRKELTSNTLVGVYMFMSLFASLMLWLSHKYGGKWGVFIFNSVVVACSILGFYFVLSYQRDGWDVFQIIGTPLVFIWPLVWLGCQSLFLTENRKNAN